MSETTTPGRVARATYAALGVEEDQRWEITAHAVIDWWHAERTLDPPQDLAAPPAEPKRYALVEQMGHRSTVGTVRETTFAGKPMLEVTSLRDGSTHLVSPESLYEITWLTEEEARSRAKPWTAEPLAAIGPGDWTVDDTQLSDHDPEEI